MLSAVRTRDRQILFTGCYEDVAIAAGLAPPGSEHLVTARTGAIAAYQAELAVDVWPDQVEIGSSQFCGKPTSEGRLVDRRARRQEGGEPEGLSPAVSPETRRRD